MSASPTAGQALAGCLLAVVAIISGKSFPATSGSFPNACTYTPGRATLLITLTLTMVALKLSIQDGLPVVPYLTLLDKIHLFGLGILVATVAVVWASSFHFVAKIELEPANRTTTNQTNSSPEIAQGTTSRRRVAGGGRDRRDRPLWKSHSDRPFHH